MIINDLVWIGPIGPVAELGLANQVLCMCCVKDRHKPPPPGAWRITLWPDAENAHLGQRVAYWSLLDHLYEDHHVPIRSAWRACDAAFGGKP